jgi:hypothetical protein
MFNSNIHLIASKQHKKQPILKQAHFRHPVSLSKQTTQALSALTMEITHPSNAIL